MQCKGDNVQLNCRAWRQGPAWPSPLLHDRSRVAKIKHADAADARVQRARAPYASISSIMVTGRVSFLVLWGHWNRLKTAPEPGTAAISTRLVLDVCYAGSFVL